MKILKLAIFAFLLTSKFYANAYDPYTLEEALSCCESMYEVYTTYCLNYPSLDPENLAMVHIRIDSYCHSVTDEKKLKNLCYQSHKFRRLASYEAFKKNICVIKIKSIKEVMIKSEEFEIQGGITALNTRHGLVKFVSVKDKTGMKEKDYIVLGNKRIETTPDDYERGFDSRAFKVEEILIYTSSWSIDNAAEGFTVVFYTPKGIYVTEVGYHERALKRVTKEEGKIKFYFEKYQIDKPCIYIY